MRWILLARALTLACGASGSVTPAHTASAPSANGSLAFLHIPKTAGSTIETLAGTGWTKLRCGRHEEGIVWKRDRCDSWHTPPRDIVPRERLYPRSRTFCIVRDPIDRLLSEFKFEYRTSATKMNDTRKARNWIRRKAANIAARRRNNSALSSRPEGSGICHFLPQSWFVWDEAGACTCTFVLRFERLEQEFDELMRAFGLRHRLASAQVISHHLPSMLARADFSDPATLEAVRSAYAEDFDLLCYGEANATERCRQNTRRENPTGPQICQDLPGSMGEYDLIDRPYNCTEGPAPPNAKTGRHGGRSAQRGGGLRLVQMPQGWTPDGRALRSTPG